MGQVHRSDPGFFPGQRINQFRGVVRGSIIEQQQFPCLKGLPPHARDGTHEIGGIIVYGKEDADDWIGCGHRRGPANRAAEL
jgi:hypothetical protein